MRITTKVQLPPGPVGHRWFGCLPEVRRDPLAFYSSAQRQFGDIVWMRSVGRFGWYLISHPEDVKHILQADHKRYPTCA